MWEKIQHQILKRNDTKKSGNITDVIDGEM